MKRTGTLFKRNGVWNVRYVIDGWVGQISLRTKSKTEAVSARDVFMRDRQKSLEQYRSFLESELDRVTKQIGVPVEKKVVKKQPVPVESFLPVTLEESAKLLDEAILHKEPEIYGLFLVMVYTGLRLVDAATLRIDEVHLDRNVIVRIPEKTKRYARNRHSGRALIGIHSVLRGHLKSLRGTLPEGEHHLFPTIAKWTAERRSDNVQAIFKKCGISKVVKTESGRSRNLYGSSSFRHSMEDNLRRAGVNQVLINTILCHSDRSMASTYSTVEDREVVDAVESALPDLRN